MNQDVALQVFFELHSNLPREGPGNLAATQRALSFIPPLPETASILDLGCGPGMQTLHLASLTAGHITAIDIHQPYLDQLSGAIAAQGLGDRITVANQDMGNLDWPDHSVDLIWAEGSAYILEFANALRQWRSLLKPGGHLAVSEVSWLRPNPSDAVRQFWQEEYPGMQTVSKNLVIAQAAGYFPLAHFVLPEAAWWDHYYTPLSERLVALRETYANNEDAIAVIDLHDREIDLYRHHSHDYGYVFYILKVDEHYDPNGSFPA